MRPVTEATDFYTKIYYWMLKFLEYKLVIEDTLKCTYQKRGHLNIYPDGEQQASMDMTREPLLKWKDQFSCRLCTN